MTETPREVYLARAAQAAYALMEEDAPYRASNSPLDHFGCFGEVVGILREVHENAVRLSALNGKVYDAWADARTAWDGMRSSDDGSKQYGLLDQEIRKIGYALEKEPPRAVPWQGPAAASAPPPVEQPRIWLTEDELESLPDPVWLLGHELIAGEVNTVFGLSGVGKTFYAIDRALQVMTQTGGGVLYVAAEDVRGVKARKNAWRTFHKQTSGAFYVWPEEVNFMDPLATAGFLLQIREIPLTLIVLDTLSQCAVGGDTSNNHDMTIFMNACIRICRETGAALLLVHHTDKNGLNYLGAQAIRASSYMMIQLADEEGVIKVICNKSRPSMPFDSYRLRIVGVGDSAVVLPAGQVSDRDAPLTEHQRKALEILNYTIFSSTGATLGDLKSSTGIPEGSIYRVLNSLKDRGYLSQGTKGHPYYITDKGRAAAINYHGKGPQQERQLSQLSRNYHGTIDSSSQSPEELSSLSHPYDVIDDSSGSDSREIGNNGVPKDYEPTTKSQEMIDRLRSRKEQP